MLHGMLIGSVVIEDSKSNEWSIEKEREKERKKIQILLSQRLYALHDLIYCDTKHSQNSCTRVYRELSLR